MCFYEAQIDKYFYRELGNIIIPRGPVPEPITDASTIDYTIRFSPSSDQKYGFDTKTYEAKDYDKIKIKGTDYDVAWKAVAAWQQETVNIQAPGKSPFPTSVIFKRETEVPTAQGASPSQKQVLITGGDNMQAERLTAYVKAREPGSDQIKEVEVGRLNIKSYYAVRNSVTIVPVNDVTVDVDAIALELQKIYDQAVAIWAVTRGNKFKYDQAGLNALDHDESDIFSPYPEKMNDFNRAFRKDRYVDSQEYYIFLIKGPGHRYSGYMPYKRQFGYIFLDKISPADLAKTIAHELGHAAFRLKHNFRDFPSITQGTTDNLMDYGNGTGLKKYQWDEIHDPYARIPWLRQGDEFAMFDCGWFGSGECQDLGKILELIRDGATKGYSLKVRKETQQSKKELTGDRMVLNDVTYDQIRIINLADSLVSFNPRDYEPFDQEFLTKDGKSDFQRGFVYKIDQKQRGSTTNQKVAILKVLLNHKESEFSQKLESFKKYLFGEIPTAVMAEILKIFGAENELAPDKIKDVRALIIKIEDVERRKEFYITLQSKVPYHNQRDNTSIATDEDVENNSSWLSAGETIGDIMCNLTSEAMCLEYLGLSSPDPNQQFEDYLEQLRRDKEYEHRGQQKSREDLAKQLGVNYKKIDLNTDSEEVLTLKLKPELEKGRSILLSAFSSPKGHIVRLQGISADGLIIDDPYGQVQDFAQREKGGFGYTNGKNSTDNSNLKGKDNLWTWGNIKDTIIKYAEVYFND